MLIRLIYLLTPEDRELARHLGVPEDDVRPARRAHQAIAASSLDAPLGAWHTAPHHRSPG